MTDILVRLRTEDTEQPWCGEGGLFQLAADEVEQLRAKIKSPTMIRPDAVEPTPAHLERAAEALLSEWRRPLHTHPTTDGQSLLLVADWLLLMAERARSAQSHG